MKRFVAIVFWTIILTVLAWGLYLFILSGLLTGFNSWSQAAQTASVLTLCGIYIGTPLLVLLFGWLGKLPDTKRSKS